MQMFIEEVMELVELKPLRNALVGLPGVDGLSTEQRKRLTIAVELVANPSIIFMDEPTSGLDARAAAIVMRTVRNTVDTGRTIVCTIHQPSIDIFEAFDEVSLWWIFVLSIDFFLPPLLCIWITRLILKFN
jgi:ABC-type multidrug transport system ATPase subunit